MKIDSLNNMTKADAQEVYRIIRITDESVLVHVLTTPLVSKIHELDMLTFLEKNGINLKSKSLQEIIDIVDCSLQTICCGRADFEKGTKNITIESKMNSGHSLPWAAIVMAYLQKHGYKPRLVYQNHSQSGEKVHIKIAS
ncbi:MAG: hypothetical protein IH784_03300 [Bacteroidetes bacterium]|nr:hypothetical protein [Bacteroidota bacterium]